MFKLPSEDRLTEWSRFRNSLNDASDPLEEVSKLWCDAPVAVYVAHVDAEDPDQWPTPWELLIENKYDDFVLALMIAYTIKLSDRCQNSVVELKTMVDSKRTKLYNLVFVDDQFVLNYDRDNVVEAAKIKDILMVEKSIEIVYPR